jgi:hypothetical protein
MPIVLGAVGIAESISGSASRQLKPMLIILAGALTAYGLADGKLAFMAGGLLLVFVLAFSILLEAHLPRREADMVSLMLLLSAGLILRGPYPFPDYPQIGNSPEEQIVHAMQVELEPGSRVLVPVPAPALAARMTEILMERVPMEGMTSDGFTLWLEREQIRAIYMDQRFGMDAALKAWIEAGEGHTLTTAASAGEGLVRLLTTIP